MDVLTNEKKNGSQDFKHLVKWRYKNVNKPTQYKIGTYHNSFGSLNSAIVYFESNGLSVHFMGTLNAIEISRSTMFNAIVPVSTRIK